MEKLRRITVVSVTTEDDTEITGDNEKLEFANVYGIKELTWNQLAELVYKHGGEYDN